MATKRGPARRAPVARRTTRRGGALAALVQLFRSLFSRSAPASGGGGGGGGAAPSRAGRAPRRRWDDDELDRDEFGRWTGLDEDDDTERAATGTGAPAGGNTQGPGGSD